MVMALIITRFTCINCNTLSICQIYSSTIQALFNFRRPYFKASDAYNSMSVNEIYGSLTLSVGFYPLFRLAKI